jgi:transcriptional regulator with XRE-family HTH domain
MDIYEKIGIKIKYARKAKGLDQKNLAKELNLSRESIVNIEAGRQRISIEKLIKICRLTGFKISEFIEDSGCELPEKIEYISKIDIAILARLEKIPDYWLKALIRMYKSVWQKVEAEESNCIIYDINANTWKEKLEALIDGLEIENKEKLLNNGNVETYKMLGIVMASKIKQLKYWR